MPVGLLLLVAGACSSGDDSRDEATATTRRTTTTTVPVTTTALVPAQPANDPVALTEQLLAAETRIGSASTPLTDLPALGHAQQVAYRQLVAHPEWMDHVRSRLPDDVRTLMEAHVAAGAALRSLVTDLKDAPPTDWVIVEPEPAATLLRYYKDAEVRTGIPAPYLASVHLVETRMGRIRGTSTAGAKGPMQFLDSTWARHGTDGDGDGVADIENPHDAILTAAHYLRAAGGPADMARALFAYNHAQAYVDAVTTYARHMAADERRFYAYHGWQVYYATTRGDVLLPVGYGRTQAEQ